MDEQACSKHPPKRRLGPDDKHMLVYYPKVGKSDEITDDGAGTGGTPCTPEMQRKLAEELAVASAHKTEARPLPKARGGNKSGGDPSVGSSAEPRSESKINF